MNYYLGIDLSTQSLSASLYDTKSFTYKEYSVAFIDLPEISKSSMDKTTLLLPLELGQAEQDPMIFLAAVDHLMGQLKEYTPFIKGIQFSAQQHGHVYLNQKFSTIVLDPKKSLWENLKTTFSYSGAPIWRSSNTEKEAQELRIAVGGKNQIIQITGSDSPLRFTGAVVKKIFDNNPTTLQNTSQIMLLNTYLAAIFSNNKNPNVDIGNGSGMSLMDYSSKTWNSVLLNEVGISQQLGELDSPITIAGTIDSYFVQKYGFTKDCIIGIGTGDNPATKVLSSGDLLSLGTSFVYMKNTDINDRDMSGISNAMYDGFGNPFTILCRTNGALIWDKIRNIYNKNLQESHQALITQKGNYPLGILQLEKESVPLSDSINYSSTNDFATDYKALVLSSLGLLEMYTNIFKEKTTELFVTGGATKDNEIVQIIANLWGCPVKVLPTVGASLGAALMAIKMIESDFPMKKIYDTLVTTEILPQVSEKEQIIIYKKQLQELFEAK